jgi:hypothetical protein
MLATAGAAPLLHSSERFRSSLRSNQSIKSIPKGVLDDGSTCPINNMGHCVVGKS